MQSVEVAILFEGETEPVIIRDIEVLKKIPVLTRAIGFTVQDWETADVKIDDPIPIPFSKQTGVFFLDTICKYKFPEFGSEPLDLTRYPEANEKTIEELKKIIELSNFFECQEYMECIGFVAAKKLEDLGVDGFADFCGVKVETDGRVKDADAHWMHPMIAALAKRDN